MRGEAPIFLLDDFAAELDQRHQVRLLEVLQGDAWQIFMTGTDLALGFGSADFTRFQVEGGRVRTG